MSESGHALPPTTSVKRWLITTNHKDVGIMYPITSLFFLLFGGVMALVNYPTLLTRLRGFLEGGASCFYDTLCRYRSIHRERSLHRRSFGVSHPSFDKPRERMLIAAFASRSASNPQAGQECSRTHNGFSVFTPQDAHSLVVFFGSTAIMCVPSSHTCIPTAA